MAIFSLRFNPARLASSSARHSLRFKELRPMNEIQVAFFLALLLSLFNVAAAQGVGWDVFAGIFGSLLGIYFLFVFLGWWSRRSTQ